MKLPTEWPKSGPHFNRWNTDLSRFAQIVEKAGAFWCMDWPLKYLTLWTDTRDGGFIIKDRDGNKIDPERVLAAIKKWDEETGEFTKNTSWKPHEGDDTPRSRLDAHLHYIQHLAQHALENPDDSYLGFEILCTLPDVCQQIREMFTPWYMRLWWWMGAPFSALRAGRLEDEIPF
jgi:hypothetical protein